MAIRRLQKLVLVLMAAETTWVGVLLVAMVKQASGSLWMLSCGIDFSKQLHLENVCGSCRLLLFLLILPEYDAPRNRRSANVAHVCKAGR